MKVNDLSILIGGEAGAGITSSGFVFAKACLRGGLNVFGANDYQSLVRGGHNAYLLRVSAEELYSQPDYFDLLLALDKKTVLLHKDELSPGGGIVHDGEKDDLTREELTRDDLNLYHVPMTRIVEDLHGESLVRNSVALGAAVALVKFDLELLQNVMRDIFRRKGMADLNVKAAKAGYEYMEKNYRDDFKYQLKRIRSADKKIILNGNESVGLGAIKAGCKFYAAYPMTPATGLLHFLASKEREFNIVVVMAESEIAAINMTIGAAFAGVRAMTATSGGGFSLMSEGLGLAGMTETPVVIMLAQRPGPSTGLPTYSAQGDLRFAIHISHGEFPRIVIAPGDVEDCFYKTIEAFNLAEKYQVPVILITDKYLVESHKSVKYPDLNEIKIERGYLMTEYDYDCKEAYKRYRFTEDGISPRVIPSTKGAIVRSNSDEHDEYGYTTEDQDLTIKMVDKRFKKLESLTKELEKMETIRVYGDRDPEVTIVGWGSTKGSIREAMRLLSRDGIKASYLQVIYLAPFPTAKILKVLASAKKTVLVENNKTAQLGGLLKEHTSLDVDYKILKYDGRPFNPGEIYDKIMEVF